MGIAIHNLSASTHAEDVSSDLAAAVRQTAAGILGTTVQLADLVRALKKYVHEMQIMMKHDCRLSLLLREGSCTSALWPFYQRTLHSPSF